jgi:hypothetical protein
VDPPEPYPTRHRPTISERAERRKRLQAGGTDRYSSLIRALHAGREVPLRHREPTALEWHPIAAKLLVAIFIAVVAYAAVSVGYRAWRDGHVDTWSGPDTSVTSGQRLVDCPVVNALHDDTFPTWIRFGGHIFRATGSVRPVGSDPTGDFPVTGYSLGDLRLLRIGNTPDGQAGKTILIKLVDVPAGELFELTPECG